MMVLLVLKMLLTLKLVTLFLTTQVAFQQLHQFQMNIIGFEQISHQLTHLFKENKLHHANLIIGNQGIGKASFAKAF